MSDSSDPITSGANAIGEISKTTNTLAKLVERYVSPGLITREGKARAEDVVRQAKAKAEGIAIIRDELIRSEGMVSDHRRRLEETGFRRLAGEIVDQQQNIDDVVTLAAPSIPKDLPEEAPANDWFTAFFQTVRGFSDKDVQALWARVLAGEVSAPGSFSLRTLDFLRTLSAPEAKFLKNAFGRTFTTIMGDPMFLVPLRNVAVHHRSRSSDEFESQDYDWGDELGLLKPTTARIPNAFFHFGTLCVPFSERSFRFDREFTILGRQVFSVCAPQKDAWWLRGLTVERIPAVLRVDVVAVFPTHNRLPSDSWAVSIPGDPHEDAFPAPAPVGGRAASRIERFASKDEALAAALAARKPEQFVNLFDAFGDIRERIAVPTRP